MCKKVEMHRVIGGSSPGDVSSNSSVGYRRVFLALRDTPFEPTEQLLETLCHLFSMFDMHEEEQQCPAAVEYAGRWRLPISQL